MTEIKTDGENFLLRVRRGPRTHIPHEPEAVEVLCADSISEIITKLKITAKVTVNGFEGIHIQIETTDRPSLKKIRKLETEINELPPVIL